MEGCDEGRAERTLAALSTSLHLLVDGRDDARIRLLLLLLLLLFAGHGCLLQRGAHLGVLGVRRVEDGAGRVEAAEVATRQEARQVLAAGAERGARTENWKKRE